jgi:hypothetical protein
MFYVVDNGGNVNYPPDGVTQESDNYSQKASDMWDDGVIFHYDSERNHIVSYFKGQVRREGTDQMLPNQFYGIYYGNSTGSQLFRSFEDEVETAFSSQGWRTTELDSGLNTIYTNLTTTQPVELSIDDSVLEEQRQKSRNSGNPVQLGTPDYTSALGVCEKLIEKYDSEGVKITICTSGGGEAVPSSDFIIVPNSSDEPGVPVLDTKEPIEDAKLRVIKRNTKSTVDEFTETNQNDARALVEAIESGPGSGVPDISEFGIRLDTKERREERKQSVKWFAWAIGGAFGILLPVVVLILSGTLDSMVKELSTTVRFQLGVVPGFTDEIVSSRGVIGLCVAGIVIAVSSLLLPSSSISSGSPTGILGGASNAPGPSGSTSNVPESSGSTSGTSESGAVESDVSNSSASKKEARDAAEMVLRGLDTIESHPAADRLGGFDSISEEIFDDSVVEVRKDSTYGLDTIIRQRFVPFFAATVVAVVLVALFAVILRVGSAAPILFFNALIAVTVGLVGWRLVVVGPAVAGTVWSVALRPSRLRAFARSSPGQVIIVLAGGWSVSQLGVAVTQQETQGLADVLITGIAGELPRLSLAEGTEILFATTAGFLLCVLLATARRSSSENRLLGGALFVGTTVGAANVLRQLTLFSAPLMWAIGLLLGVFVGLIGLVIDYFLIPRRLFGAIRMFLTVLVVGAFVESQVTYTPPVGYNTGSQQFTTLSSSFGGYTYSSVFFSLVHLLTTVGVGYVLIRPSLERNKSSSTDGVLARTVSRLQSLSLQDRTVQATLLIIGGVSAGELAKAVVQQGNEGLVDVPINFVADEVLEGFLSPSAGIESVFFFVTGLLFVVLAWGFVYSDESFVAGTALLGIGAGLLNLQLEVPLVSTDAAWVLGAALGAGFGGAVVVLATRLSSKHRVVSGVRIALVILVLSIFIESQIAYSIDGPVSFSGYAYSSPLFSAFHLFPITGAVYVLLEDVLGGDERTEVLVIGPEGGDPDPVDHLLAVKKYLLYKTDKNPKPNQAMKDAKNGKNERNNHNDSFIKSFKLTPGKYVIWTPQTSQTILGKQVFDKLKQSSLPDSRTLPDENLIKDDDDTLYEELAAAISEADIIVLLFPVDVGDETPDEVDINHTDSQSLWYLEPYLKLLENHIDNEEPGSSKASDQKVLGVIPEKSEDKINRNESTTDKQKTLFEGCPDNKRNKIRKNIEKRHNSRIPVTKNSYHVEDGRKVPGIEMVWGESVLDNNKQKSERGNTKGRPR